MNRVAGFCDQILHPDLYHAMPHSNPGTDVDYTQPDLVVGSIGCQSSEKLYSDQTAEMGDNGGYKELARSLRARHGAVRNLFRSVIAQEGMSSRDKMVITWGKNQCKTFKDVFDNNPEYVEWTLAHWPPSIFPINTETEIQWINYIRERIEHLENASVSASVSKSVRAEHQSVSKSVSEAISASVSEAI